MVPKVSFDIPTHRLAQGRTLARRDGWRAVDAAALRAVPVALQGWIEEPASMTRRLERHFGRPVTVKVLSERRVHRGGLGRAGAEGLPHPIWSGPLWVRDVALVVGGDTVLAARTLTPLAAFRGLGRFLRTLGTRPLGHILFETRGVEKIRMDVARLDGASRLRREMRRALKAIPDNEALWARRGLYCLYGHPLLVTEIFSPVVWG